MKADQLITPTGIRIFSPDDWIVTVYTSDGRTFKKGVDPSVDRDEAVNTVLRICRLHASMIEDINVRRRRDTA